VADKGRSYLGLDEASLYEVNSRRLLDPRELLSVIGAQDCVLDIGAGDSFADIYGFKRFFFLWWSKAMAVVRGVPLILSPQTIGPFTRQPYRSMGRWAMERADSVVARDHQSFDILKRLAPRARAVQSVDVAFALPFEDRSRERGSARLRAGVNVSGLLLNEAESGRNRFGLQADYSELMRRFMGALVARGDVEVHLISHATSLQDSGDDDAQAADRFAAEFPGTIRVPDFAGPCEAKSYISSLDYLVAGRMHACIAAYSSGTPVVPVAYSRKFGGLFGTLGYDFLLPVKGLSTEDALQTLIGGLERRQEMKAAIAKGMEKIETLLDSYRNELRVQFAVAGELAGI
ncbi:MAG TPA: polysaccharide pyruvyl transferase family protein, partial [Rhizorhapis sp.]|nr:polysaccharide pyruvyl transferase family protein [Rhizorhapis sp.]